MLFGPGTIGGAQLAGRIAYYIGYYGTPCWVYTFARPVLTGAAPSSVSYSLLTTPVTVMIQMDQAARDAAAMAGILDQQAALGFTASTDAGKVGERDILKDAQGRYWTVHSLPDGQPLADPASPANTLAVRLLLTRLLKPPASVV